MPLIGGSDVQRGKRPLLRWESFTRCRPTRSDLQEWSETSAYGVICGSISGLVVLDLDDAVLAERFFQRFPHLIDTFIVQSGTRSTPHIYWRVDFPVKTRQFPGADLKAEGGYVVGPGSQIADARWQVLVQQPVRSITRDELETVIQFLRPEAPLAAPLPASATTVAPAKDYPAIYRFLVERVGGRNQALFTTARYMRDAGHIAAQATLQLADLHARQSAVDSACKEPYSRRYAEALRTIASVYSRPAQHQNPIEDDNVSYYPNQVREALLSRPDGAAIGRTLEGAVLRGVQPGALVTEPLLCRLLSGLVSRETIRKALRALDENGVAFFCPPENPPADAEIPDGMASQKDAFLSGGQKQTTCARQYQLPTPSRLCQRLGISNKGSDPITLADIRSSRLYRQALHRGLLKRRPGTYAQRVLAKRLGISPRSVRRYNRDMPIQSTPTYRETPILWLNLSQIPQACDLIRHQLDTRGQFLLDETGKRWPVKREIAAQLLQRGLRVSHMHQRPNYYWYGELEAQSAIAEHDAPHAKCRHADTYDAIQAADVTGKEVADRLNQPYLANDVEPVVHDSPDSVREGRLTRSADTEAVVPAKTLPARHKRRFKRPLVNAVAEQLAQRAFTAIGNLSLPNARRLVETYGNEAVQAALRKLSWLRENYGISNPVGMLVTLTRTSWRSRHQQPAPGYHTEPLRKPRHVKYVAPPADPLWESTAYQAWRTAFFGLDDYATALPLEEMSF